MTTLTTSTFSGRKVIKNRTIFKHIFYCIFSFLSFSSIPVNFSFKTWNKFTNFSYGVVVTINATSKNLYMKETAQLTAIVNPSTESATITWASNNTSVASVDKDGVVTANVDRIEEN